MKHTIDVSGGIIRFRQINDFIKKSKNVLDLIVFDMPNNSPWCSGRINDKNTILKKETIEYYNKYNIGFYIGFTNSIVLNLHDEGSNELLKMIDSSNSHNKHGVIVQNAKLNEYIKRIYPNLKQKFSVTGHPNTEWLNFEMYYKDLESRYDTIVPRAFHLKHLKPLWKNKTLDPNKYEILIDGNPPMHCRATKSHHLQIDLINCMNMNITMPESYDMMEAHICHTSDYIMKDNTILELNDLGLNKWKITGREETDEENRTTQRLVELEELLK